MKPANAPPARLCAAPPRAAPVRVRYDTRIFAIACALALITGAAATAHAQRVTLAPPAQWEASSSTPASAPPKLLGLRTSGDPERDYTLNCRGCHRADGAGTPGAVPPLAGSIARFLAVAGGREYLARVPGVAQSALDDAALAALLNWMLVRFDGERMPADFRPYAADELASVRNDPLVRVGATRAALLAAMGAED